MGKGGKGRKKEGEKKERSKFFGNFPLLSK
jgi:hypothetical protein